MDFITKHNNIVYGGLLVILVVMVSCDSLTSYNENPNEPQEARTTYLLTNVQKSLSDTQWDDFNLGRFGNLYAQYWSQTQYTDESRYSPRTGSINSMWADYYLNIRDLEEIIRLNRENPDKYKGYGANQNQIAVAKILKAWSYQMITDVWGAAPYKDAMGGRENPSPKYSSQEEIYTGIIKTLTEASDSIDVNASGFTAGDVIYDGNMTKWKKFANSLKMRAAMRIADAKPQLANTAINEAISAGAFESNEDNAVFTYKTAVPNNNPINEAFKNRNDFAVSEALVGLMKSNSDPRLPFYADPASTGDYLGYPYGLSNGAAPKYFADQPFSYPSSKVRDATAPALYMLYDEVLFIKAEAAERGYISGTPANFYEQAIEASINYWSNESVSQSDISSYIANVPYNASNFAQQKWLALYMQGVQGWSEFRRLDFTGVLQQPAAGKKGTFGTDFPQRYPYPNEEYNLNQTNLKAAIEMQGADNQGTKLWWDQN
ncbi:SusD/RagB family nutrient-binding outer membrane lipoprotein [Fodinibius halophilus]|uniref:SusD/RagB family nutrient-binding outer membrane lipoprotein n=1 Tax=Fodinibius halophilus TaxID=1736908 RepID=A0A6M1TFL2_9BACT|nr:SusD/RagB family nutrient-binding outer membrane lipoprotein [Fodinibius halophilus]NGP89564.1 SusD/RagB family nutrient-binding outer membrane lipoprotein [Fodinibius halophilus]